MYLSGDEFSKLENRVREDFGEEIANNLVEVKNISTERFQAKEDVTEDRVGETRIPTGYILDKILSLRGAKVGRAALSPKQVLVIINLDNATSHDVMELFRRVRRTAYKKLGIVLENEPELFGFDEEELKNYFSLDNIK